LKLLFLMLKWRMNDNGKKEQILICCVIQRSAATKDLRLISIGFLKLNQTKRISDLIWIYGEIYIQLLSVMLIVFAIIIILIDLVSIYYICYIYNDPIGNSQYSPIRENHIKEVSL